MKSVLLLGDSIRLGYEGMVKDLLKDIAVVESPGENCRWTKYTYWNFSIWAGERHYDVIHWNNGIWDMHRIDDEPFCSVSEYARDNERLAALVGRYTENMIWATTIPGGEILDQRKALNALENTEREYKKRFLTSDQGDWNRTVRLYNSAAVNLYRSLGVEIDDLYAVFYEHLESYISDDGIHPNEKGYEALARHVADAIRKRLMAD